MDCWGILGIGPTEDEGEVKRAYLEKLPEHHPEEDPEGFRQLRGAMEEALKQARLLRTEKEAGAASGLVRSEMLGREEIQDFLKQTEALYRDYGRRIQPEEWEKLLLLPVCQEMESQREAGWALLGFLMNHFHLPHSCFEVFDRIFGWQEDEDDLYQHFPEGFVDYLYDRIEEEDSFRYDILEVREGFDYDSFCEAFFSLRTALGEKDREAVESTMEKLDAMGMEHPDLTVLKIRHESMQRGHERQAWELARKLYEQDPENSNTRYWYVRTAMDYEESDADKEELEELIKSLLEREPEFPGYWQLMGDYVHRQGDLAAALGCYQRCQSCSKERWEFVDHQIRETAEALADEMEEDPEFDDWWQLANVCWQAERYEQVRELLENQEPTDEQRMSWLIMMAGSCHETEDYELAANYRQEIWDLLEPEKRPFQLYVDLADEYRQFGDTQRALEIYEQAEKEFPEDPEIFYRRAEIMSNEGLLEEAERLCNLALEFGFHRDAFNLRLEILLDLERYQEVREAAEELFRQNYQIAQVRYYYARALRGLEENEKAEEVLKELAKQTGDAGVVCQEYAGLCSDLNRPAEALAWIDKALAERVTPNRRYMKGQYLHDLKRYEEEIELYQEMMETGLDSYYIHYRVARALEGLHRYEEAEAAFRRTLERNETNGVAWDGLGDMLQNQGKWEEAAQAYEKGWENGNFQAIRDLCRLMKRTHQDERALEYLRQGLAKLPDDGSLLWIQAIVLRRQKKYEEAVCCLGRYMEVKPSQTASAYREIAHCWESAKEYAKAEEAYQKAIDYNPRDARSWRVFGKYYANERQQQETALPYLEKAVELEPESTYGWMKLGEVYEALGQKQKAEECYERSLKSYQRELKKDPTDCCSYEGIADVLIHLGRLDEAEEMVRRAISLQNLVFTCNAPICFEALEDLAKIEERRGNPRKALEWMERAGEYSVTDYYPREIARLKAVIAKEDDV